MTEPASDEYVEAIEKFWAGYEDNSPAMLLHAGLLKKDAMSLIARIRQQEERIKVMDEALAFYAEPKNYEKQLLMQECGCCSYWDEPAIDIDNFGDRARAARKEPT